MDDFSDAELQRASFAKGRHDSRITRAEEWRDPMTARDHRHFVEACLDAYYEHCSGLAVGVPEAMRLGESDGDGWCSWKMLPSSGNSSEVAALETQLPCRLPPVFRAFLTTRLVLDLDFGQFQLPELPSDEPL